MKGLILKDLYSLLSYWKSVILVLAIFLVISVWQGNYTFFSTMMFVIIVSSSFNTFSYDDFYHWNEFSITLPMTKSQIIKAKYATTLLLAGVGLLISIAFFFVVGIVTHEFSLIEFILTMSFCILFSCYFIAVCVPTIYKFGHEKMRIYMTFIIAAPTLLILGLGYLFHDQIKMNPFFDNMLILGSGFPILLVAMLFSSIMLLISYRISVGIFEKKEF